MFVNRVNGKCQTITGFIMSCMPAGRFNQTVNPIKRSEGKNEDLIRRLYDEEMDDYCRAHELCVCIC